MNITINKGTTDVIIDIHDLIDLLKSNRDTRQHASLKLKEHLLGIGEDIDLYSDEEEEDYPSDIVNDF